MYDLTNHKKMLKCFCTSNAQCCMYQNQSLLYIYFRFEIKNIISNPVERKCNFSNKGSCFLTFPRIYRALKLQLKKYDL